MAKIKEIEKMTLEPGEVIQQWLQDPDSAFAYLLSYLQKDSKNNIFEKLDAPDSRDSLALNSWGIATHNLENLYSVIKDYALVAPETEYAIVLGYNEIFQSALKATENLAEELIIAILRDETGKNTSIQYGSGSAWGNEKETIVRVAQTLFEILEINRKWEAGRKLKKQRKSD